MSLNYNVNRNQNIPLYSQTSNDWGNKGESNYAVNLDVGINEYIFSRTTPNNDFIVSTGLVNDPLGIKMVGGRKNLKKKESNPVKKESKSVKKESKSVKKESKPVKKESKPVKKESKSVKKESKLIKPVKKESKLIKPVKKESKPVKKEFKLIKPVKKNSEEKKLNLTNKVKKFLKNSKDKINIIIKKIVVK